MLRLTDIPNCGAFAALTPLDKGWSPDEKYRVETCDGKRLLLRVADIDRYDDKKTAYAMMERAAALGVPMSLPVDFGVCGGGKNVYMLLTWLDGVDAEELLPGLSRAERYALGTKAGELLRTFHTLPAPDDAKPWGERFRRKLEERIGFYNANPVKCANGDKLIRFLTDNQGLLDNRPQTFHHGDFNASNLIVLPDGRIGAIDFNAFNSDHGDPWWELCFTEWGVEPDASFYSGLYDGYFTPETPPRGFFVTLRYYFAYDALAALCDTSEGVQGEPEDGRRHAENVLRWFSDMKEIIPEWYSRY